MRKRIVYCPTCEREVELKRRDFQHKYHEIMLFSLCLTLGLAAILFFILKRRKTPNTCPHCERVFDLNALPETPKMQIQTPKKQTWD